MEIVFLFLKMKKFMSLYVVDSSSTKKTFVIRLYEKILFSLKRNEITRLYYFFLQDICIK